MAKKSPSLTSKIDYILESQHKTEFEVDALFDRAARPNSHFSSAPQLQEHLCEGSLLNVGTIASNALSIPCGEYMVWVTDVGHTMLVPTKVDTTQEVFEAVQDQYEVVTPDLLANWRHLDVVNEESDDGKSDDDDDSPRGEQFQSSVNPADIDRKALLRAMEDRGYTVTSLAAAAGVDPPAISRLLRTPKRTQGDPKGRNPSMGLAAKVSNLLRVGPTSLFPDIFGISGKQDLEAKNVSGNSQSGSTARN
ncbi:MAG: helix-turn-helix domain-containing protein [Candidatus Kariarchaeaceae archaeon]|jgi:transcriptional regulator with XRE-family HTH domain